VARLGWIAVGALLVVAAVAGIGFAGRPGPLTGVASATPTPPSQPTAPAAMDTPVGGACYATELSATITSWDGAAGSRVATVVLTNGGDPCTFPKLTQPQLLDAGGAGLIIGTPVTASPTLSIPSNGHLTTMVEVGNYCGPAPVAPVTVAFVLSDGTQIIAAPDIHAGDINGLPPCMGSTQPATIQMQAWQR
jgi:hypothetical protein